MCEAGVWIRCFFSVYVAEAQLIILIFCKAEQLIVMYFMVVHLQASV
jgi:hypothetical protein